MVSATFFFVSRGALWWCAHGSWVRARTKTTTIIGTPPWGREKPRRARTIRL